ncbi:MAG TPA: GNAT family protein [Actinomycetota bacterium]
MTELTGALVVLRPFRPDELEALVAVRKREPAFMGDGSRTPEEALRRRIATSGTATRHEIFFAIEADGRLVGEIQGRRSAEALPPGVFELGIEVYDASDRGRGYASEAISLLSSHLFECEGAHRVQASTDLENGPMRRVLERLGFAFEGVLRGFMPTAAMPRDYAMYAITSSDRRERAGSGPGVVRP